MDVPFELRDRNADAESFFQELDVAVNKMVRPKVTLMNGRVLHLQHLDAGVSFLQRRKMGLFSQSDFAVDRTLTTNFPGWALCKSRTAAVSMTISPGHASTCGHCTQESCNLIPDNYLFRLPLSFSSYGVISRVVKISLQPFSVVLPTERLAFLLERFNLFPNSAYG